MTIKNYTHLTYTDIFWLKGKIFIYECCPLDIRQPYYDRPQLFNNDGNVSNRARTRSNRSKHAKSFRSVNFMIDSKPFDFIWIKLNDWTKQNRTEPSSPPNRPVIMVKLVCFFSGVVWVAWSYEMIQLIIDSYGTHSCWIWLLFGFRQK